MYLDVVGLVTIGIGCQLSAPDSGVAIGLLLRATGEPATSAQIIQDWSSVKSRQPGLLARLYEPFTATYLPAAAIDAEASRRLEVFVSSLRRRFPMFYVIPRPAQIGLLDMAYSLGAAGLFAKYPKFCAAVDRQDWQSAADECKRAHVSWTRNAALAALFVEAKG